jgi:hypothetical protein
MAGPIVGEHRTLRRALGWGAAAGATWAVRGDPGWPRGSPA